MSEFPPRPSGTDEESVFHQSTHDKVHGPGLKINNTSTIKATKTTKGWFLHVIQKLGGQTKPGGMNYLGDYDPTVKYNQFDVVRKRYGDSQGVWINVKKGGSTGVDPVFPEPAATVPGTTNTWDLFTFGVQTTSVCQGGSKVIYVNATAPLAPPLPTP